MLPDKYETRGTRMLDRKKKTNMCVHIYKTLLYSSQNSARNGQSFAHIVDLRLATRSEPCWELMNVVICRVRVFDFPKPLQGTSPALIGCQGWRVRTGKRVLYCMKPKRLRGSEKIKNKKRTRVKREYE